MLRLDPNISKTIPTRKPNVIVVDDEPFIQLALESSLKKLGCLVDKAGNGKIALNMINNKLNQGQPYDLIFMDANMPLMSGYEAARILRQNPNMETPIVCVSAQDSIQHKILCKESGMNEILSKPCTIKKLTEILSKYLQ